MTSTRALLTLFSVGFALAAWEVQAQTFAREGPLSVTFHSDPNRAFQAHADRGWQGIRGAKLRMTASNDQGNPILNTMAGRCQFSRLVDTSAKTLEQHGYCTYAGNDGDHIFGQCDFMPGTPNSCKLIGGTGKFQGLEASIVITAAPVKSNFEGIAQIIGQKKGTYRIVKTP